jgi:hypothetical protein
VRIAPSSLLYVRHALRGAVERGRLIPNDDPGHPEPPGFGFKVRSRGGRIRWSPEIAAAFATIVDIARVKAGVEGRTMIYVVRACAAVALTVPPVLMETPRATESGPRAGPDGPEGTTGE